MPISMSNPFSSLINSSTFLTRYIIWKVGHLYIIKPTLEGTGHICSIYLQTWLLGWKATIFSCKRRCSKLTSSSVPLYKRCTFNFLVLADLVPSFYQVLKFSRSRRSLSLAADVDQATPSMCWRAYSHTRESPEGGGVIWVWVWVWIRSYPSQSVWGRGVSVSPLVSTHCLALCFSQLPLPPPPVRLHGLPFSSFGIEKV